MTLFLGVFSLFGIVYAIMSGLVTGSTFLLYLSLKSTKSTRWFVVHVVAFLAAMNTIFYAGQLIQAFFMDPAWPRAVARYLLLLIFTGAVGVGLATSRSFARRAPVAQLRRS